MLVAIEEAESSDNQDTAKGKEGQNYIVLDKSVTCGLFNSTEGKGSLFGIKLSKDVTIPLTYICEVERDPEKFKQEHVASNIYSSNDDIWKDSMKVMA